ncbi:MAG: putative Ig domain-containing protein [Terracidiphilus sp.]|nr:putative Ig domain-containing protein [Terracidiphilus sp.]
MRFMQGLVFSLTAGLVLLCGCGNHGSSVKAPAALSYTTATAVYTKGSQITPNVPTVSGGAVVSYSVSPALPAGLILNTSTGIVVGTPTTVAATATYTIAAINTAGSTTATLSITVNDQPPAALSYATQTAIYPQGAQIAPNTPANSGGTVIAYSVSPALPAGLSLSAATGIISGAPTAVTAAASYTVTATNSGGSATDALSITVMAPPPAAQQLPNVGQQITPLAPFDSTFEPLVPGAASLPKYPNWQVGQAVSSAVSPDGNTLLVLTSGYNRIYNPLGTPYGGYINVDSSAFDYASSQEYVFIYDISKGTPVQKQVAKIPNSYNGLVFDPSGTAFYVSGGMGDYPFINGNPAPVKSGTVFTGPGDNVHVFALGSDQATWEEQPELVMGHLTGLGLNATPTNQQVAVNNMVAVQPMAAGIAIASDGKTLAVANYYNDSITVFTGGLGNWTRVTPDIDLRPGGGTISTLGTPGGEYPFWVAIQGTTAAGNTTAYVSSIRDREIDVVNLTTMKVAGRIPVKGEPIKMSMNRAQSRLYVAEDMSDTVDVIDISKGSATNSTTAILETIPVVAPAAVLQANPQIKSLTGANSNSVTLSPDESQLYVTNGNLNAVAVVPLSGADKGDQVAGLIPTGWYPNSVSFGNAVNSPNGNWVYVLNGKSPTGPDPGLCYSAAPPVGAGAHKNCLASQQYNPQQIKAGFQSFPQPTGAQLATLTAQTVINNRFANTESASDQTVMAAVHKGIQHVIFIIKENRGYDQVLGDLEVGNGDPSLTEFGAAITPNQHKLASSFVTLDNFMASSETSTDGWPWTTGARSPDVVEKQFPVTYAGRGLSIDSDGEQRNVNVAIPTMAGRVAANSLTPHQMDKDGDELPGSAETAAPDGPDDVLDRGKGYLWDAALRAGLTVRNYGFFVDTILYACPAPTGATCMPLTANLNASDTVVAYPTSVSLTPYTDPYYRGFDNQFPDYYRFKEWERDFNANYAAGGLPALSLVRLMHDHTGNFGDPGGFKINTPELQVADNDYAVGLLIQKIAGSIYANNTLIFVIEDDSQDSGDHVDSHRTIAFVAGAYVKQQALVSTQYNTINFVRTMEEVLGLPAMNLNDAVAKPMADIFNTTPSTWSFTATVPAGLYAPNTALPLTTPVGMTVPRPTRNPEYWARATRKMNFTSEDEFDFAQYNRVLWRGLMGNRPYPAKPNGRDLRQNREQLLARYQRTLQSKPAQAHKPVSD